MGKRRIPAAAAFRPAGRARYALAAGVAVVVVLGAARAGDAMPASASPFSTRAFPAPPAEVRQWEIWELFLPAPADRHAAPPELHFVLPDGAVRVVPMFYDLPRRRSADDPRPAPGRIRADVDEGRAGSWRRGQPDFIPAGPPAWRGRFAPGRPGRYAYEARAAGGAALARGSFTVRPPAEGARGFIRRHPALVDRFATDDGRGWFALGHNVCWVGPGEGVGQYEAYFDAMAAAGENFTRVWLCTWDIDLDGHVPDEPDPVVAARLDAVFDAASRRGIYIKLCLDNFHDFRHCWELSPFHAANGGACRGRLDFWTLPEARAQYRRRLRRLVARYSAFASLMAWELWNEVDYALTAADVPAGAGPSDPARSVEDWLRRDVIVPWTREMAADLKRLDPHGHLVVTSLGMHANWPELWEAPELDFAQFHSYIHRLEGYRTDLEKDGARLTLAGARAMRRYGKPALIAEFGYMGDGLSSALNALDPDGVLLHNSLWAGTMSGLAGSPLPWWWDNYIEPRGLYREYRKLADFLAPVDWSTPFEPVRSESEELRLLGLRGGGGMSLVWLQNRESAWHRRLQEKKEARTLECVEARFFVDRPGRWRVTWFDPEAGRVLGADEIEATVGADGTSAPTLLLAPPPFRHDLAARLEPLAQGPDRP